MASRAISDLYQRYKSGTKKVVQWLAEAAGSKDIAHSPSEPDSVAIILSTDDLLHLAREVGERADSRREAPKDIDNIIVVLGDVISWRRECSTWFRQKAELLDETAKERNRSHEYFVGVLQTVLEQLKQACEHRRVQRSGKKGKKQKSRCRQSGNDAKGARSGNELAHRFDGLAVEETPTEAIVEDLEAMAPATSTTQYTLETQEDDQDFALWCFLKECDKIRKYIRRVWVQYKDGELALSVAGMVTDTAFMLIHHAADEFVAECPKLANFSDVVTHLEIDLKTSGGRLESFNCRKPIMDQDAEDDDSIAEMLCIPAYISFALIRASSHRDDIDRVCDELHHAYAINPAATLFGQAGAYVQDHQEYINKWLKQDVFDTFWDDVMQFTRITTVLPLYTIIEFQIYLDTMDLLADLRHTGACESMLSVTSHLRGHIAAYENEIPRILNSPADIARALSSPELAKCTRRIRVALEPFDAGPGVVRKQMTIPALIPLFLHFPVLCGWFANHIELPSYLDGINSCNQRQIVLIVAHLYVACRETGLLKERWEDMEFVIENQGRESLGLSAPGARRTLEVAARDYDFALGAETHRYGNRLSKRQAAPPLPLPPLNDVNKRAKRLKPTSAYYLSSFNKTRPTKKSKPAKAFSARHDLSRVTETLLGSRSVPIDDETRLRWGVKGTLTPVQFLTTLHSSLVSDEVLSHFNHHDFFRHCAFILKCIKMNSAVQVEEFRALDGLSQEYSEYEMVSDILWDVARPKPTAPRLFKETILAMVAWLFKSEVNDKGIDARLLNEAKDMMEKQRYRHQAPAPVQAATREDRYPAASMGLSMQGDRLDLEPIPVSDEELQHRMMLKENIRNGYYARDTAQQKQDAHERQVIEAYMGPPVKHPWAQA